MKITDKKSHILLTAVLLAAVTVATLVQAGPEGSDHSCLDCHGDAAWLKEQGGTASGTFVEEAAFMETAHGPFGCTLCHMGTDPAPDMEKAHSGLIPNPADLDHFQETCGACHADIAEKYTTSLHATLAGEKSYITERYGKKGLKLWDEYCFKCHATCSDCHLKKMNAETATVETMIRSHQFSKSVDSYVCSDCHTQTGFTFTGWRDKPASVHFRVGLECVDCHSISSMHGDGTPDPDMASAITVTCESCHENTSAVYNDLPVVQYNSFSYPHETHQGKLSCESCHMSWYMNCEVCHLDEPPHYRVENFSADRFYLGKKEGKVMPLTLTPFFKGFSDIPEVGYVPKMRHSITDAPNTCEFCHTQKEIYPQTGQVSHGTRIEAETLERIYIDPERFGDSLHGQLELACTDCHRLQRTEKCLECHDTETVGIIEDLSSNTELSVLFHYDPEEVMAKMKQKDNHQEKEKE